MNRRDVLKGMVAAGLTAPLLLSDEQKAELLPPNWPRPPISNNAAYLIPPKNGIDFDGVLGSIYLESVDTVTESSIEQLWVKRLNGGILIHDHFDAMQNYCWLAEPTGMIHGPLTVECSCTALIILAGPDQMQSGTI